MQCNEMSALWNVQIIKKKDFSVTLYNRALWNVVRPLISCHRISIIAHIFRNNLYWFDRRKGCWVSWHFVTPITNNTAKHVLQNLWGIIHSSSVMGAEMLDKSKLCVQIILRPAISALVVLLSFHQPHAEKFPNFQHGTYVSRVALPMSIHLY